MNKRTWIVRKRLSQIFKWLARFPDVSRKLVQNIAFLRWLARGSRFSYPDYKTEKNLFSSDQFIYVANPKVATRSVLKFLADNYSDLKVIRQDFDSLSKSHNLEQMQAVTFVRNPWARVYSCWQDKISNKVGMADVSIISRYRGLYPDMPFWEFVYWLNTEEGSDAYADRHWMSQSELLNIDQTYPVYAFIGKLEQLDQDFEKVSELLGIQHCGLGHLNSTSSGGKAKPYMEAYDGELIELVQRRYQNDITRFDYSFNDG